MAVTITPAVSGAKAQWRRDVFTYAVSAAAGGLLTIVVAVLARLALTAAASRGVALATAVGLSGLALMKDIGFTVPVPYRRRQVPSTWRTDFGSSRAVSLAYGFTLGVGFMTLFTSSTHLVFVTIASFATWPVILLGSATYGIGKALVLVVAAGTTTQDAVVRRIVGLSAGPAGVRARQLLGAVATAAAIGSAIYTG